MSGRTTSLALIALCALSTGCRQDEPAGDAPDEGAPLGQAAYEARLAEESGTEISLARLAELAAAAEASIEARMDEVARSIQPGDDWRPAFVEIRRDYPDSVPELLDAYRREVLTAAEFLADRAWVTLPPTPPRVVEAQSPIIRRSFSLALYMNGLLGIVTSAGDEPAPAYLANHCRVCIPPLAVHEAYPGHHVAFYHAAIERAGLDLGDPVEIRGQPVSFFFHEGWGLDAELMMLGAGYYQDPARELGAWRMLLLRAARARIDALLHRRDLSPEQATKAYERSLLMEPQAAATEVRRHLRKPVSKATYLVGLLQLRTLRRQALAADPGLDPRSFNNRLLRRPRRIPSIAREEFALELAELQALDLREPRPSDGQSSPAAAR